MNADQRLLYETAEILLIVLHGHRDLHDRLHALLIAARSETREANDPPEWPAERAGTAMPPRLRDRLARLLVGREGVWSFTEEEGAVVNELIVWALKMPGGSAP